MHVHAFVCALSRVHIWKRVLLQFQLSFQKAPRSSFIAVQPETCFKIRLLLFSYLWACFDMFTVWWSATAVVRSAVKKFPGSQLYYFFSSSLKLHVFIDFLLGPENSSICDYQHSICHLGLDELVTCVVSVAKWWNTFCIISISWLVEVHSSLRRGKDGE